MIAKQRLADVVAQILKARAAAGKTLSQALRNPPPSKIFGGARWQDSDFLIETDGCGFSEGETIDGVFAQEKRVAIILGDETPTHMGTVRILITVERAGGMSLITARAGDAQTMNVVYPCEYGNRLLWGDWHTPDSPLQGKSFTEMVVKQKLADVVAQILKARAAEGKTLSQALRNPPPPKRFGGDRWRDSDFLIETGG